MGKLTPNIIETKNIRLNKDGEITYADGRTDYIDYGVTSISQGDYNLEGAVKVVLPESITTIDEEAFWECESLTDITISKNVTEIGIGAFTGCKNLRINISPENKHYEMIENNLYTCGGETLLQYFTNSNVSSFDIPDTVTEIAECAFYKEPSLKSVSMPEGVEVIGKYAFFNCEALKDVHIPEGTEIIGESAFDLCDNITSINIPASVKEIGKRAFFTYGDKLKDIYYGGSKSDWKKIKMGAYRSVWCDEVKWFRTRLEDGSWLLVEDE